MAPFRSSAHRQRRAQAFIGLGLGFALAYTLVALSHGHVVLLRAEQTVISEGLPDGSGWSDSEKARQLSLDVWSGGSVSKGQEAREQLRAMLTPEEQQQLKALCGRCLWHTLQNFVVARAGNALTHVATGDIPDMWIRDSAVQMGLYLPRVRRRPALRRLVEGALRTQAFFTVQDPYANAYSSQWRKAGGLSKFERLLGRGGWVGTRNYELDSGAYFIMMLWDYWSTPGIHARRQLVGDALILDAVSLLVDVWITEQHHEQRSPYRYSELPRDGLGSPVGHTGMTWSGFRPSDDAQKYGYLVPSNMYAAAALERVLELNREVWRDEDLGARAERLLADISAGIEKHGIVEPEPGVRMYAYEVDGLGNSLHDFDDANVPSLLSIPLLGWSGWDREVYAATRARLLSKKNSQYFESDKLKGIGSPHTPSGNVWPIALAVEALTSDEPQEQARIIKTMLKLQCGNGLMHESVSVNNLNSCTRPVFEWANAMLVVLVEDLLGWNCEEAAEEHRLEGIKKREDADSSQKPKNGGQDLPIYYESLEDTVRYAGDVLPQR